MTGPAYAACLRIANQHYENFPVASRLLPAAMRPQIAAVYAFARAADDFADEGDRTPDVRLALLDDWHDRLQRAAGGRSAADGSEASMIFTALADTMARHALPVALFEDLLSAFRQDVTESRYPRWDDLLDYARRSANPVGRIVLRIAGYDSRALDAQSDAVCTALQLTNFWQDLAPDWDRGRLYVPLDLLQTTGADERALDDRRLTPEWQAALREACSRTREFFAIGRPVTAGVRGRLRWELRATWLGGMRILDRLETSGFDVFRSRPALGWTDALPILWRTMAWQ